MLINHKGNTMTDPNTVVISALEGAFVVGGLLSALTAALLSIGIPKNSIVACEAALKADGFMIVVHGSADEMARAKSVLSDFKPASIDLHEAGDAVRLVA